MTLDETGAPNKVGLMITDDIDHAIDITMDVTNGDDTSIVTHEDDSIVTSYWSEHDMFMGSNNIAAIGIMDNDASRTWKASRWKLGHSMFMGSNFTATQTMDKDASRTWKASRWKLDHDMFMGSNPAATQIMDDASRTWKASRWKLQIHNNYGYPDTCIHGETQQSIDTLAIHGETESSISLLLPRDGEPYHVPDAYKWVCPYL